jgi:hypothetical protein
MVFDKTKIIIFIVLISVIINWFINNFNNSFEYFKDTYQGVTTTCNDCKNNTICSLYDTNKKKRYDCKNGLPIPAFVCDPGFYYVHNKKKCKYAVLQNSFTDVNIKKQKIEDLCPSYTNFNITDKTCVLKNK